MGEGLDVKTKLTFWDMIAVAGVLCLALLLAFFPRAFFSASTSVKIIGETYEEVFSLGKAQDVTIESYGHSLVVHIDENGVYVKATDCEDKICKNSGVIEKSGQIIVCAPAGVRIEMISGDEEADYVIG
jgi:hypothetical protein